MRCGVPAIMFAPSSFDLPQNEQRNPLAFIFAIIGQVSNRLERIATLDARSLRLLNHTPWLAWQTLSCRVQRRAQPSHTIGQYV